MVVYGALACVAGVWSALLPALLTPAAAVLVPLHAQEGQPHLVFTRRTDSVEHHKGQISFPGGEADREDRDLQATALREAQEELGIDPAHVRILGALDDVYTFVSGFVVTPFVGLIPHPYPFRASAAEIAEVLMVPLATFRDPAKMHVEERNRDGWRVQVYFYHHGAHEIWGATARIMKDFIDAIFGEPVG